MLVTVPLLRVKERVVVRRSRHDSKICDGVLTPEISIRVLQVNQMALGTGNTVRIELFLLYAVASPVTAEILPKVQAVFAIRFALIVLGGCCLC